MKTDNPIIGGVEITPVIVNMLSDWTEPNEDSGSLPRINHYVNCLSETQDFITKKGSTFEEYEMREMLTLLKSIVNLKYDLNRLIKIQH